ncbi:unnamed protein product [Caenorhabditis auriculariae]|uniref:BTB domain-containing protein n=1 Tax=Caenorhabditis auriculariae TaxID=2777116 RepID=A0A8S1GSI6_9PELO|nr:unnamed protein product [Caenorhabditis auriculariae]
MHRGRQDKLSARWKRILMKDCDDVVIERAAFDDFSSPSPWRTYEIVAIDQVFYVNAGWLAELSPYFAENAFCRKPPVKRLVLDDVTPEECLEFIRCIFFCPMRKPLSVHNVSLVLRLANRFEMRPVIARCEQYVGLHAEKLDRQKLFQVTCAMSQCDPNSSTMSVLVDRLAAIKDDDLSRLQFAEMPGDVVAEVYAQKIRSTKRQPRTKKNEGCCFSTWARSLFSRRPPPPASPSRATSPPLRANLSKRH